MTDNGGVPSGNLDRNTLGNIVLKSSYCHTTPGELKFCHFNPGSAIRNIGEIRHLFHGVGMHVICVSESWFKDWHTEGHVEITGYQVIRADRLDGRRAGGVAVYIKSDINFKTLKRSPETSIIDYVFVEIMFHGVPIMIGSVYIPPGIDGLDTFNSVLREHASKYIHVLLVGDFNINLLANSVAEEEFRSILESASLTI
jgi:exonuclease III